MPVFNFLLILTIFLNFCSEQFEDPLQRHIFDNDDDSHDFNDAVRKMISSLHKYQN